MSPPSQARTRNRLLAALSPDDLALLQPHLEQVTFARGAVLITPGKRIRHVHFLESGIGSVIATEPGGDGVETGLFGCEGLCGAPVLLHADRMPAKAVVQVNGVTALRIPADILLAACRRSEALSAVLLRYVQTTIVQAAQTVASNARYALPERLARWLLMCHDRVEGGELSVTHAFLGVMLAVRRAGVTVTLHALEGEGAIRSTRGMVTVLDRARLEAIAGDAYGGPEAEYRRLIGPFGRSGAAKTEATAAV